MMGNLPPTEEIYARRAPQKRYGRPDAEVSVPEVTLPQEIERAMGGISNLPTLPTVVANMIRLVDNPRTSARDLERHISTDPALTAKILRLVNSAYYGFPNRIGTVSLAVVILGFDTVKAMGLTVSVFNMFSGADHEDGFDAEGFWEHSFGCALVAEILSKMVRYRAKGEAFTAGVLHDIGKIALDQFMPSRFERVIRTVRAGTMHIARAEREVLGVTHAEVGGWLAQLWHLPHHLTESLLLHHDPGKAEIDPTLTAIVHLADVVCRTKGIGSGGDPTIPRLDPTVWSTLQLSRLGMEEGELDAILARLENEMGRLEAFSRIIRGKADDSS